MARKYQHTQQLLGKVKELLAKGMTQKEAEDTLGLDNSIVAYKAGTQQTVNLVLDTIRLAMKREKKKVTAKLQLHSNQGFQYTSQAYFDLTKAYNITPSMPRRGNCYDNAMAENFFSILKTECI